MEVMKQLRQRAIRDLVGQRPIRTQQELAAALRDRGFRTTQATISRDVAELGLIKVSREGTTVYALPPRLIEAETSGEERLRKLYGVLHADRETLRGRIAGDTVLGPNSPFRLSHLEPYAEAARTWLHAEAEVIDTTHLTPAETALRIAEAVKN